MPLYILKGKGRNVYECMYLLDSFGANFTCTYNHVCVVS